MKFYINDLFEFLCSASKKGLCVCIYYISMCDVVKKYHEMTFKTIIYKKYERPENLNRPEYLS